MGKQTLFLHIGLSKTGSTAIQTFVRHNLDKLQRLGLSLLDTDLRLYQSWPSPLTKNDKVRPIEEHWQEVKDLLKSGSTNALHSNEIFTVLAESKPTFVKDIIEFIPDYSLKIIVYIRRQDKMYESGYLQNVEYFSAPQKFDPAPSLDRSIAANGVTLKAFDYYSWLKAMKNCLREEDDVVVRVYDRDRFYGQNIFQDFVHALGIDWDPSFTIPKRDPNPTIDGRYAELCRKSASYFKANTVNDHNQFEEAPFENMLFYRMMQRVNMVLGRTNNKNLFSHEERLAFLKLFEESNRLVAKEFLGKTAPLFDESDLADTEANKKDEFKDGEMEMALLMLHKIWLDCACFENLKTMNYLRLRRYRRKRKEDRDDQRSKRVLFFHKLVHSIGKRLFKKWGGVPQMEASLWSMPARNTSLKRLQDEVRTFEEYDTTID